MSKEKQNREKKRAAKFICFRLKPKNLQQNKLTKRLEIQNFANTAKSVVETVPEHFLLISS